MALKVPDALKADVPQTLWGKMLAATPVIMTVIATLLAGLSSSEMTRAQYARSLATQHQSKAGDQWAFFQAKRLRGALQRNTLDLLQSTTDVSPLAVSSLKLSAEQLPIHLSLAADGARQAVQSSTGVSAATASGKEVLELYLKNSPARLAEADKVKAEALALLESAAAREALVALQRDELPAMAAGPALPPALKTALEAIETSKPETEIAQLIARVSDKMLDDALRAAKNRAGDFDAAAGPVNQVIDRIEKLLARQTELIQEARGSVPAFALALPRDAMTVNRDFTAARMRYSAHRYEVEARLNQALASLYEVQVRKGNIAAERHHNRSQSFFYGMLVAQAAVIIATFAMAARKRSVLWSLAAAAGVAAVFFGAYVYLYV